MPVSCILDSLGEGVSCCYCYLEQGALKLLSQKPSGTEASEQMPGHKIHRLAWHSREFVRKPRVTNSHVGRLTRSAKPGPVMLHGVMESF